MEGASSINRIVSSAEGYSNFSTLSCPILRLKADSKRLNPKIADFSGFSFPIGFSEERPYHRPLRQIRLKTIFVHPLPMGLENAPA
jgi:hypothetical protein